MIDVQITDESLAEIAELRRRHRRAVEALAARADTPLGQMLIDVTLQLGQKWEQGAPWLYGVLSRATRERIFNDTGRVFIDPSITHPVLGGRPAVYGPVQHRRTPWVERVVSQDAPRIVNDAGQKFFREIGDIYR